MNIKIFIIPILALFLFACNKNEPVCYTCNDSIVEKNYGNNIIIKIPNVITPNNYEFCDSMVFSPLLHAYVEPYFLYDYMKPACTEAEKKEYHNQGNDSACPCMINKNSVYNDNKNAKLIIQGIDKLPYNRLTISVPNSTEILAVIDNYNNQTKVFQAFIQDSSQYGNFIESKHLVGRLTYKLELYKDAGRTKLDDVITGGFTVIRTPQECPTTGCAGIDADDPLLTK